MRENSPLKTFVLLSFRPGDTASSVPKLAQNLRHLLRQQANRGSVERRFRQIPLIPARLRRAVPKKSVPPIVRFALPVDGDFHHRPAWSLHFVAHGRFDWKFRHAAATMRRYSQNLVSGPRMAERDAEIICIPPTAKLPPRSRCDVRPAGRLRRFLDPHAATGRRDPAECDVRSQPAEIERRGGRVRRLVRQPRRRPHFHVVLRASRRPRPAAGTRAAAGTTFRTRRFPKTGRPAVTRQSFPPRAARFAAADSTTPVTPAC